jgi:hypothetical protein
VDTEEAAGGPLTAQEHRALLAEIAAEVKARRASGALPASVERELAAVFAANAPVGTSDDDPAQLLRRAEAAAHINPAAPTDSRLPGGAHAKLLLRRSIGWCLGWIAGQSTTFNAIATRLLRVIELRLQRIEDAVGAPDPASVDRVAGRAEDRLVAAHPVATAAVQHLPEGRVLVARGGGGRLCEALVEQGVDAYLVEPDADASFDASATGLDARPGRASEHLHALPPASLAGAILVGDPDEATPTAKVALASAAHRALRPGGVLVVLGTDPATWGKGATAAAADLSLGRPWKATTWAAVLTEIGFTLEAVEAPKGTVVVVGRTPSS